MDKFLKLQTTSFFYGCFNWMMNQISTYIKSGCFTKHPLQKKWLFRVHFTWDISIHFFEASKRRRSRRRTRPSQEEATVTTSWAHWFGGRSFSKWWLSKTDHLGGGNSLLFHVHPEIWGKMNPFWLSFLQMGWNHQPVIMFLPKKKVYFVTIP